MYRRVVYVHKWSDPDVYEIRDDCMLPVAKGVYFHHRLQLLIVIGAELPLEIANYLPF